MTKRLYVILEIDLIHDVKMWPSASFGSPSEGSLPLLSAVILASLSKYFLTHKGL